MFVYNSSGMMRRSILLYLSVVILLHQAYCGTIMVKSNNNGIKDYQQQQPKQQQQQQLQLQQQIQLQSQTQQPQQPQHRRHKRGIAVESSINYKHTKFKGSGVTFIVLFFAGLFLVVVGSIVFYWFIHFPYGKGFCGFRFVF